MPSSSLTVPLNSKHAPRAGPGFTTELESLLHAVEVAAEDQNYRDAIISYEMYYERQKGILINDSFCRGRKNIELVRRIT